jgi:hypothetical protein
MQENGKWRRYNSEIYKIYDTNVIRYARLKILKLAGSVTRMTDEPIPKYIIFFRKKGKRWIGRPKTRWLDGVIDSKRIIEKSNYTRQTRNRD